MGTAWAPLELAILGLPQWGPKNLSSSAAVLALRAAVAHATGEQPPRKPRSAYGRLLHGTPLAPACCEPVALRAGWARPCVSAESCRVSTPAWAVSNAAHKISQLHAVRFAVAALLSGARKAFERGSKLHGEGNRPGAVRAFLPVELGLGFPSN